MSRPATPFRRFAGSLLLSGAVHASLLTALAIGALGTRELLTWHVYEVDIEPEPPRATLPAPPAAEPEAQGDDGVVGGVPGGAAHGTSMPFHVGPGARVGDRARPAAAQAGRVLASEGDDGAEDFTMVQGASARYAGGVTTSAGTSATKVTDTSARGAGVIPEHVARPARVAPATEARRPALPPERPVVTARPLSTAWSCPFPSEADTFEVHFARVLITVTVNDEGRALGAAVLSDPGFGFGTAARACALHQRYGIARDTHGRPRTGTTAPFYVTFTR
ncbi:MAG: hypothetical protein KC776_20805 [Myxococcales bacterium]|nr:hypothetical protein [Myxococcales bacterium]MCB9577437.1 hypothetical protein [Polyangiaceae bacterium]